MVPAQVEKPAESLRIWSPRNRLRLKLTPPASDESTVADKDIGRWIVLGALVTGLLEVTSGFSQGFDPSSSSCESLDLAGLEIDAEAGDASAQTRLGDHYSSVADHGRAVVWYRKAASSGVFEAQLALASCYLAGQGVEKSPLEAAKWLRAAAACLEQAYLAPEVTAALPWPSPSASPLGQSPGGDFSEAPAASLSANGRTYPRIQRVLMVQVVQPELQEPAQPLQLLKATP
jgi:hypothetical protein